MPNVKNIGKSRSKRKIRKNKPEEPRLSRTRIPFGMSPEVWQVNLRRQFGREQAFVLENLSPEPVFSEFLVTNPQSKGRYRVAIRGAGLGINFCSCPDFATNDLGTCKHIEYTLAQIEKKPRNKAALQAGFHPTYSEIYLHYAGERGVRFRPGSSCPKVLANRTAGLFDEKADWSLPQSHFGELEGFLLEAEKAGHEIRCYDDALTFIAEVRDSEERCRIIDEAYAQGADSPGLADLIKTQLYPYQAEGALFAARAGRALIGDEMGLGKTIQAIAATELMARHFGAEQVLVVCPTSLKHQWKREIARFTGKEAQVIQGGLVERHRQYRDGTPCKIANYEILSRDLEQIQSWSPDVVIVDEAQRIKNWNTIAARALKRIESPYAIVLTGTPLENRLEELVSIVQFVDRHRLGPTWRLLHNHQLHDEHGRVVGYRDLDHIGATLAPIMLRRRKSEVLEQLPARVDNTLFVAMTQQQRDHHEENREIVARIVNRWRSTGYLSEADQRRLTCALQNMRMSCNSTFLLDHESDHGYKADELTTLMAEWFEQPDAKVVIFSQWLRTHELIIRRLEANGWGYVLFHGGVPGEKRGALVERFNNELDCRVFLSTDAGGVGLNLQHAAAIIVNMDLPWNPAVLEQRIGRVYRLGQSKSVQVVNFVAQGTIEEGMLSLLSFKKSLFAGVLDGGDNAVFLNGTRLSNFMKSVEEATGSMGEAEQAPDLETDVEDSAEVLTVGDEYRMKIADKPESPLINEEKAPRIADTTPPMEPIDFESPAATKEPKPSAPPTAGAQGATPDPWADLIGAGLKLVENFSAASNSGEAGESKWIETDERTGKSYLKMPMPEPETVVKLTEALTGFLASLRRD